MRVRRFSEQVLRLKKHAGHSNQICQVWGAATAVFSPRRIVRSPLRFPFQKIGYSCTLALAIVAVISSKYFSKCLEKSHSISLGQRDCGYTYKNQNPMPGLYQGLSVLAHRPFLSNFNPFKLLKFFTVEPFQGHTLCFNWQRAETFA